MDLINFRNVLSKFATGVTVVSTIDTDNNPIGMTVNSFSSVSLDPPLVLWSIGIKQPSYDIFMNAKGYSVNILSKFPQQDSFQYSFFSELSSLDVSSGFLFT